MDPSQFTPQTEDGGPTYISISHVSVGTESDDVSVESYYQY